MVTVESIVEELKKFSEDIIFIGESIEDDRILKFEIDNSLKLPEDFKEFISKCNGINLMGSIVFGFYPNEKNKESMETVYYYEHNEVIIPQYSYLVPFSPDGRGNFYCLDINTINEDKCDIVFWTSNYQYSNEDKPELTHFSFLEWIKDVIIDWTLEDYDYDGNDR